MPLARIFTHHPERTTALSSQLREQGYTIEVVSPDQAHLSPADLEIEFDICERADVLERAAILADELKADIAVAPGAIQAATKAAPIQRAIVPEAGIGEGSDREREFEDAFAASSEAGQEQSTPVIEIPVMERAPLPPVAFADEAPAAPMHSEVVKPADPVPYLAQLMPFGTPQVDAEIPGAELRLENSPEREPDRPALVEFPQSASGAPAGPSIWQRGANYTARAVANARAIAASAVVSFREQSQEYRMKAKIRSAEARAAHEARLLDLEQRQAEAQQRAAELEAAREAAAARLVELVRQRDPGLQGLSESPALDEQKLREEAFLGQERKAPPIAASTSRTTGNDTWWHAAMAVVAKKRPPMSPQLRAVLTGAAAVTVFFIIAIVLGSLYPRSPLAQPTDQASKKTSTPSSNVASQSASAATKASVAAQDKPSPAKATQSSAATVAHQQAPASRQDKPAARTEQVRQIAAQQGEEEVGDDVVIRHFQRPVPTQKPKQSGQQAGLKHFSDLDASPSPR
ncbi:MAG TPA: hypothetical protein VIB39_15765 [Candidatus Angelobacter sp.]|jgi:hypothetical protein